jgi:hypothetical protein
MQRLKQVRLEEMPEVLRIASELYAQDQTQLARAEEAQQIAAAATEVGLPAEYLERAATLLAQQRAEHVRPRRRTRSSAPWVLASGVLAVTVFISYQVPIAVESPAPSSPVIQAGGPHTGANMVGASLPGASFAGQDLSGADLQGANLEKANLRGAHLDHANLVGTNLAGADLSGADLTDADLQGANLSGANLARANLTDAGLVGADLQRANLTGTVIKGANLQGANMTGAKYDQPLVTSP